MELRAKLIVNRWVCKLAILFSDTCLCLVGGEEGGCVEWQGRPMFVCDSRCAMVSGVVGVL